MNQFVINTDLTLEEVKSALRQGAEALKRLDEIKSVVNYAPSNARSMICGWSSTPTLPKPKYER